MKKIPFSELSSLFTAIKATYARKKSLTLDRAIAAAGDRITGLRKVGGKVIMIGNGGSSTIAAHIVTDLLKVTQIPSVTFNDASTLTCLANDMGYERVFSTPIKLMAKKGDVLIAVSSSGASQNILDGVTQAKKSGCFVIGLSGFSVTNPLRVMGDLNFFVPSFSYGNVEIVHLAICHAIVDLIASRMGAKCKITG